MLATASPLAGVNLHGNLYKKGPFITVILKSTLSFVGWERRAWHIHTLVCTCAKIPGNLDSSVKSGILSLYILT